MIIRYFLICIFCFSFSFSDTFRVASYNVENLFDLERSGHEYKEYIPYKHNWNQKTYKKKIKNISKVILDIDADIIGLQEIESLSALKDLKRELKIYPYHSISKVNSTVKCALLSKYPITKTIDLKPKSRRNKRTILETHIDVDGNNLIIFINHWKSKRGGEHRRLDYAKVLKNRIDKLHNQEYILLGDFNSNYNEYKTFINDKKLNTTDGKTGINHVLKTIKYDNSLVSISDLNNKEDYLYNLWLEIDEKDRYSHKFFKKKGSLDSIILSFGMFDNKGIDYIKNSFHVFKEKYLFYKKKFIKRWWIKRGIHKGDGYSDHLAIYADLSFH